MMSDGYEITAIPSLNEMFWQAERIELMHVSQIPHHIENLMEALNFDQLAVDGPFILNVKREIENDLNSEIEGGRKNGIYVYASIDGKVLYIGRGNYASNDGIGHRTWKHLGSRNYQSKTEPYPNHQWVNDDKVEEKIKDIIAGGAITMSAFPVNPNYFIPLIERYLLTMHMHLNDALPPLNKEL